MLVEKQRYAIGETVKANCTTPPSNPATNVTWTVNGIPVILSLFFSVYILSSFLYITIALAITITIPIPVRYITSQIKTNDN